MNGTTLLTLARLLLLPVIIYFLQQEELRWLVLAMFLFLGVIISGVWESYWARTRGHPTRMGTFLDPFADRILVFGLLLYLVLQNLFWWVPWAVLVLRDIIVIVLRWYASRDDFILLVEKYSKIIVYAQYGLILGVLLELTIIYDGIVEFFPGAAMFTVGCTIVALILSITSIMYHIFHYVQGVRSRKKVGQELRIENSIILANTKARGYHDAYRRHLLRLFARRRKARIIYLPLKSNMYAGIRSKLKSRPYCIIAGGDGSFESALNHPAFHRKSLGFFPLGAGNSFYSYFYRGKRFEYLRSRFPFREMELDVLELEWDVGTLQTTFLSLGLDAEVLRFTPPRTKHGLNDYIRASVRALVHAQAEYRWKITVDGVNHTFTNGVTITLGKIPYYGFGLRSLVGKIPPWDGQVYGVAVVNNYPVVFNKLIRLWGLVIAQLNLERLPLVAFQGREILIESTGPFPLQAGGEFLGYATYVQVKVKRKQKVLVI